MFRIAVNDVILDGETRFARIHPGHHNTLTFTPHMPLREPVRVTVQVRSPSRQERIAVRTLHGVEAGSFDLGPLICPSVYEYENGVVYRCGYYILASITALDDTPLCHYSLFQGCSQEEDAEVLELGMADRVVYDDGWVPEGAYWNPFIYSARPMNPPIEIRLSPEVLIDPNDVRFRYRLGSSVTGIQSLKARLNVVDDHNKPARIHEVISITFEWEETRIDVCEWPPGTYRFEVLPVLDSLVYSDGPSLTYYRRTPKPNSVLLSPFAPFRLERDAERRDIEITDWNAITIEGEWMAQDAAGCSALVSREKHTSARINLDLSGFYALFVRPFEDVYVRVGDGLIRLVPSGNGSDFGAHGALVDGKTPLSPDFYPVFVTAEDFTGKKIEFRSENLASSGVKLMRLIPITEQSVVAFWRLTRNPPVSLRGVDDWWTYFDGESRTEADQFDVILAGQREVGITSVCWAVGRSYLQYPTRLPAAQVFPCRNLTEELVQENPHYRKWSRMVHDFDALAEPLNRRKRYGIRIYSWLAMNRHYGSNSYNGVFTSAWVRKHPEFHQFRKNKETPDVSRVEFFFKEARRERIDILVETARYNPDGIVVGCCRQPPMAGYNPQIVQEYRRMTGQDPRELDLKDRERFIHWLKWRCEGLTQLLRDLRREIRQVEETQNRRIPIAVRVPSNGLFFNIAEGMDVETWISEGLVDELQLNPLQDSCSEASHDVRPYIDLCRRYGVPVYGGINGITATLDYRKAELSPVVGIKRALGLINAGVDGIEIYEAELFAAMTHQRWLIPLWGNADVATRFLHESNLEAVFPVTASNAMDGSDNHWLGAYSLYGTDRLPRGATDLL